MFEKIKCKLGLHDWEGQWPERAFRCSQCDTKEDGWLTFQVMRLTLALAETAEKEEWTKEEYLEAERRLWEG